MTETLKVEETSSGSTAELGTDLTIPDFLRNQRNLVAEKDAEIERLTNKMALLHCINGTLRTDAERYSALRRGQKWSVIDGIGDALRGDELDAAIDAAMVPN